MTASPPNSQRASQIQADSAPAQHPYRPIRSFVLRQGRLTAGQERALTDYWQHHGIPFTGQLRSMAELFGRAAPTVLEIGFGNGEALSQAAKAAPQDNYLGIEVHTPGVGRLLATLTHQDILNVKVYHHDASEVIATEIPDDSLREVRIYFPDPWHKKRHHKRRLIQPAFTQLLAAKIQSGGCLHLATDWDNYVQHMWDVLDANSAFRNRAGPRGHLPRPLWRPKTHFEQRGQQRGHPVWDLLYDRL